MLAKRQPTDAPHLILSPEILLDEPAFLEQVRATVAANKYCIVVVGEGLRNAAGAELRRKSAHSAAAARGAWSPAGVCPLGGIDIHRIQIMAAARWTKPRKWMALRS